MICKQADDNELEQAFAQVFEIWPHDPHPLLHLQKRLASVQHQRATWFVLVDNDEVVCSLGAYPFQLFGPGEDRAARAFGAVFTPRQHRGNGHAVRLLWWVMEHYAEQGTLDFILYSDIAPAYYEKLGFQTLPSYEWGWTIPASGPEIPFAVVAPRPLDPDTLGFRFGIRRQTENARWAQDKQNQELRLSRCQDSGIWLLSRQDHGTYTLLESNLSQSAVDWPELVRFVESDARQAGCQTVKGWWLSPEKTPAPEMLDRVKPRQTEILMWTSLREPDPWAAEIGQQGFLAFLSEHV